MKIKSIRIQNFKTFGSDSISFTFNDITALIGENSVGKSNILEALDLFFNFSKAKISFKSFHHDNFHNPIIIELCFYKLNEAEIKTFKSHLDESKNLTITQHIEAISQNEEKSIKDAATDEIDFIESKHGTKLQPTAEYEWAVWREDKLPTKKNILTWWKNSLQIGNHDFKALFESDVEPTPEVYNEKLKIFYDQFSDDIPQERVTGDEKVLGWKSKLKANLPKYFYIPAIKNVADDLKVTKTSALGELIGWLSASVSKDIKDEFRTQSSALVEALFNRIDLDSEGKSRIGLINKALNDNIGFDIGCSLEIKFGRPEIQDIIFPQPMVYANDGYDSELTNKGHGIQRLALFSLLRTYNTFDFGKKSTERNIIIGIEEPEIYLHPPLKRATYNLLRSISTGNDQVIYTTHDSFFISVEYFDEIRLFRKSEGKTPVTKVYELPIVQIMNYYKSEFNREVSEKSIRDRFCHIIDETKNEGFFAKKIILIEGETEKYALPIYFKGLDFDIDSNRIALISAGSVDLISYLLLIFNEFSIPCYVIFDADKPKEEINNLSGDKKEDAKNKSRRNKELIKLLGLNPPDDLFYFPSSVIDKNYAAWEYDFEEEFHKCVSNYKQLKSQAKSIYGSDSKPLTARFIAEHIVKNKEHIDSKIKEMIEHIKTFKWNQFITKSE